MALAHTTDDARRLTAKRRELRKQSGQALLAAPPPAEREIELRAELLDFRIGDLRIPGYQRPVQFALVKRIVNDYQPRLMLPLVVNLRPSPPATAELLGPFTPYVIDGQQRLTALKELRWDDRTRQCITYRGLSEAEEAYIYTETQRAGNRKNMTPIDHLRGAAAYGDPAALAFLRTLDGLHVTLDEHQPGHAWNLRAVAAGLRALRYGGEAHLARVLRLLIDGFPVGANDNPVKHANRARLSQWLISGMSYFLRRHQDRLDEDRLIGVLRQQGLANLFDKMNDFRRIGTSARWEVALQRALVQFYNHGLPGNSARRLRAVGEEDAAS